MARHVRHSGKRRNCRGVSVVEMALVLPLLLVLTLGAIEYGWLFLKAEQVADAARSGARFAVTPPVTTVGQVSGSSSPAVTALNKSGIPIHSGTITVPTGVTPGSGNAVTVVVTVPYSDVKLTGFSLLPVPSQLSTSVTMAKEGL